MTKPLVRQSFIQVPDSECDTKTKTLFFLMPPCSSRSPPNYA